MRFLRQSLIGLVLAALSLGLLAYAAQLVGGAVQEYLAQDAKAPPARERVFAVSVVTAQPGTETPTLESFGEIRSRRTLEVRAVTNGRVIALSEKFEDGGKVQKGDVLVQIDPADAQSGLERAQADMQDAEAEVRDAERSIALARDEAAAAEEQLVLRQHVFERQEDLERRGVGTTANTETAELAVSSARQVMFSRRQAVSQAEARIDQTQTRLARARIALSEAQRELDDTTIVAPFDGTLSEASLVQGRLVSANEKLAVLIDPNALEVSFRVSTAQYTRLLNDAGILKPAPVTVTLSVSGLNLDAQGVISRASAAVGENQTGRLVFAHLDRAAGFKPGDFVTVSVEEPPLENVVRLPAAAVDSGNTVLALGQDNRLDVIAIELVRRQGDDVLVRSDMLAGREVVEARSPLLGAGISVRPLRTDGAEQPAEPEMLELSEERRAKLVAFVEANKRMPAEAKARVLARLNEDRVPAQMVARLEGRMGG